MIAVIDYGAGNLFSVQNVLEHLKIENMVTGDAEVLEQADALILPGVGAFPDAMDKLHRSGLAQSIRRQAGRKPLLGICLGMQLLFDESLEFLRTPGLGLIPGRVTMIPADKGIKIPHVGWNSLELGAPCALTETVPQGAYVYFVHSYMAQTDSRYVAAYTHHGCAIPALVCCGHVFGAQFHPEKSGEPGLAILKAFADLVGRSNTKQE